MLNRPYATLLFCLTLAAYAVSIGFLFGAATNSREFYGVPFLDAVLFLTGVILANLFALGCGYLFRAKFYRFREGSLTGRAHGVFYVSNFALVAVALFGPIFLKSIPVAEPLGQTVGITAAMSHLINCANATMFLGICLFCITVQAFGTEPDESPFK